MKILGSFLIVGVLLIITGCSEENKIVEGKRAELRLEVFKECMRLAGNVNKAETQHYNDLDEVVDACALQSFYLTNHMYVEGELVNGK